VSNDVDESDVGTYHGYLESISKEAQELGYTLHQVLIFNGDIHEAWLNGDSIAKVVDEIFG